MNRSANGSTKLCVVTRINKALFITVDNIAIGFVMTALYSLFDLDHSICIKKNTSAIFWLFLNIFLYHFFLRGSEHRVIAELYIPIIQP